MTKIFIVEDEMIIAADLSMMLTNLGYEVAGLSPRAEDALGSIEATQPDIVLMDINLKGNMDGVEAAQHIYDHFQIPVIFLTANADDSTFERAKKAKPYAFLTKPFRQSDLRRSIELVVEQLKKEKQPEKEKITKDESETSFLLSDRIFVRHKDKLVKVFIQDILFAEADRNYCMVHTPDQEYLLTVPLRVLEENLPEGMFMRVHRSFVVNLGKIDAVGDNHDYLAFGQKTVPVSRRFKETVVKRLRFI